ncbi:DinB family protein [Aquincola sp. S2]|uniref:DinB family protein n=1 Tax=Pseudaquabacterium terrae TaxID=2732868 RepID=A0ABX2EKL5_9BURK|nr:DinB family protein [Aquabacterium terrae]NRF69210.1 DinB family protein [Aquabacterium terrae]
MITRLAAPHAVRSSRLPAPPSVVWPRICDSAFVADYLGAALPPMALEAGCALHGHDAQGRALTLTVLEALPPSCLSLQLQAADGVQSLRWSIAACAGGSRLTVVHERPVEAVSKPTLDPLASALAAAPLGLLPGARIADAAALQAARAYLAGSAEAVRQLLAAMPPHEGYEKPAPDRFSLVEHLWHLADVEALGWAQRWPRVLAETEPTLAGVDGDRLAIERRYQQRPWRAAARRFIAQRRRTLSALARCDATTLARPLHFGGQATDAGALLAAMLAHDQEHRVEMALLWTSRATR